MSTAAVYNQYWTTGGGAETYGAAMAQVLARSHAVELVGPEPVDPDELARRLRVDLAGVSFRQAGPSSDEVAEISADYDLFVNVSYLSNAPSRAPRSIYVVHFPAEMDGDLSLLQRAAIRTVGPLVREQAVDTTWGEGFYPREGARPRCFWTDGDASFFVRARSDVDTDVRLVFVHKRPVDMDAGRGEDRGRRPARGRGAAARRRLDPRSPTRRARGRDRAVGPRQG